MKALNSIAVTHTHTHTHTRTHTHILVKEVTFWQDFGFYFKEGSLDRTQGLCLWSMGFTTLPHPQPLTGFGVKAKRVRSNHHQDICHCVRHSMAGKTMTETPLEARASGKSKLPVPQFLHLLNVTVSSPRIK